MSNLISVAIVTWNRSEDVLKAIESVYNQEYRPFEIVVVDSASKDDTVKIIREKYPEIKLVRLHRNMGCPEGRNVALVNCSGDIIFSLDDDGWLHPKTLGHCYDRFKEKADLGIIACKVIEADNSEQNEEERYINRFRGGAFAVRRKILKEIGYFPANYFRQGEEMDLSLRLIDRGYSILYAPNAIMYHKRSNINRNSKLFMFYASRNDMYTVIKRYPWYLVPFALLWKLIVWNFAGIKKISLHFTLSGSIVGLLSFPLVLSERNPVSCSTIRNITMNRIKNFQINNGWIK